MALGLKGWIVLALLLLSGVGVWLVPPGQVVGPKKDQTTEAHRAWVELDEELRLESWMYQHIQRRDSLVAELRRAVASGHDVVLGTPPETADSLRSRLEASVGLHVQALEVEEPAMPFGVFFVPRTQFLHPDLSSQYANRGGVLEYYVARGDEDPFCIIGAPFQDDFNEARPPWSADPLTRKIRAFADIPANEADPVHTLGLCKNFIQYGPPGQKIFGWLQGGAFLFSLGVPDRNHFRYYPRDSPSRGPFGALTFRSRSLTPQGLACLQGISSACLEIMLAPEQWTDLIGNPRRYVPELGLSVAETPVDFFEGSQGFQRHFRPFDTFLFAALEEEFGSDRFGQFWRSPLDPEVAFREAFGQPMDQWAMEWIRGYLQTAPRGPGVPAQATFLAILTLGILAGGAVRLASRRGS